MVQCSVFATNPLVARSKTDVSPAGPSTNDEWLTFGTGAESSAFDNREGGQNETHADDPPLRIVAACWSLLAGAAPVFAGNMREAALEKAAQLEQQLNELKSMVQAQKPRRRADRQTGRTGR